jgi:hypothetical protein
MRIFAIAGKRLVVMILGALMLLSTGARAAEPFDQAAALAKLREKIAGAET